MVVSIDYEYLLNVYFVLSLGGEHNTDPALKELTVWQGRQGEQWVNDTGMENVTPLWLLHSGVSGEALPRQQPLSLGFHSF